jgi:hypothetical protein
MFDHDETTIVVRAKGYQEQTITAEQSLDGECVVTTTAASVGGALLFVVPIVGLFYLPWCTEFEEREYRVNLEPLPLPRVSAGRPTE